jgi:hypothetical protein
MFEATAFQECCDIVDNRLYPLRCIKEATVCENCEIWKAAQDMISQWCTQELDE